MTKLVYALLTCRPTKIIKTIKQQWTKITDKWEEKEMKMTKSPSDCLKETYKGEEEKRRREKGKSNSQREIKQTLWQITLLGRCII